MRPELQQWLNQPEQIYTRVLCALQRRLPLPAVQVQFCAFANANSSIRLNNGTLYVRMSDILTDAPADIIEALAYILVSKLYQKAVPGTCSRKYRAYLNQKDVRHRLETLRKERGRKLVSEGQGRYYDLENLFEEINREYFGGLMARPKLGWSLRASRTTLGHYDSSHHLIVLSKALDREEVPRLAVEYVMFHEMLHLRYPVEHEGPRRCVHTKEFKQAEKQFRLLAEAKELLKRVV